MLVYCLDADDYIVIQEVIQSYFPKQNFKYLKPKWILQARIKMARFVLKKQKKYIKRFALKLVQMSLKPFISILNNREHQKNIDIINTATAFFSPFAAKSKNVTTTTYTILHDVIPNVIPNVIPSYRENVTNTKSWFNKLIKSLNSNDYYFAVSEHTRQDFLKYYPQILPHHIITAPLACDEVFFVKSQDEIYKSKVKYNIPLDKKYIFSLCTLEPRKNLIRVVDTFLTFTEKHNINDMVLVLGGGSWDKFVQEFTQHIGILSKAKQNKILKIGYVDEEDLPSLYSGALWFVYTSMYEGFGLPPLEAMSCGCPIIITSNNTSLPEVVGDAGIMIDYDSDEQHIEAYEKYYFNERLRSENSQKGLERAKQFSWKKCVDIMVDTIKATTKSSKEDLPK